MPAKHLYHDAVVAALIADGWTITDDPLTLGFGGKDPFVDLGAEGPTLAAEEAGRKIAVGVHPSTMGCPRTASAGSSSRSWEVRLLVLDEVHGKVVQWIESSGTGASSGG